MRLPWLERWERKQAEPHISADDRILKKKIEKSLRALYYFTAECCNGMRCLLFVNNNDLRKRRARRELVWIWVEEARASDRLEGSAHQSFSQIRMRCWDCLIWFAPPSFDVYFRQLIITTRDCFEWLQDDGKSNCRTMQPKAIASFVQLRRCVLCTQCTHG